MSIGIRHEKWHHFTLSPPPALLRFLVLGPSSPPALQRFLVLGPSPPALQRLQVLGPSPAPALQRFLALTLRTSERASGGGACLPLGYI